MRYRRLKAALVASALAVTPAAPAHAAHTDGLDLVLPTVASMLPGQRGWVSAIWTANLDVCNVRVTATGPGLTITYPTNTGTFTSFYNASALAAGNIDYTAFNVSVPANVTSPVALTLSVSYNQLPPGQIEKDDDLKTKKFDCKGPKGNDTATEVISRGPAGTADVRTAAQKAEDTFIGTLAAHLCNVQSTVYDDPRALAAAYQSLPSYPGLDAGQVSTLQKRLISDPAFSARLTNQLKATCHPAAEITATP